MKTLFKIASLVTGCLIGTTASAEAPYLVCNADTMKISIHMPNGFYNGGYYAVLNANDSDSAPIPLSWDSEGSSSCRVLIFSFNHKDTQFQVTNGLGCNHPSFQAPEDATAFISLNGFDFFCREDELTRNE